MSTVDFVCSRTDLITRKLRKKKEKIHLFNNKQDKSNVVITSNVLVPFILVVLQLPSFFMDPL